ncbi:MAG: YraN family protein [Planctomycetota bacterium]
MSWLSNLRRPRPLGERGERHAARMLRRKGHRVLFAGERNRFGEFDLITIDERTAERRLVFVEVKTRRNERAGSPAEAVNAEKQRRLTRAAWSFLRTHDLEDHPMRFDVVAIVWPPESRRPMKTTHLEAAFDGV